MSHELPGNLPTPEETPPTMLVEPPESPGPGVELTRAATAALTKWQVYTDANKRLALCAFSGETLVVSRVEVSTAGTTPFVPPDDEPGPEQQPPTAQGPALWLRRQFGRLPLPTPGAAASMYSVSVTTPDGTARTCVEAVWAPANRYTHTNAVRIIRAPEGRIAVHLEHPELPAVVSEAAILLQNSLPLSPESAIAANQNQPCERIIGGEAAGVQRTIERLIETGLSTLGDPRARHTMSEYSAILPRLDGQWSVHKVRIFQRPGAMDPYMEGPKGRSVVSLIEFGGTLNTIGGWQIEGTLQLWVEGVYSRLTNQLIGAEVRYYVTHPEHPKQTIAIDPYERAEIHRAIANQVTPGTFMRLEFPDR